MGFVDNMLHTESTKVVSLSNNSHSEGKSRKMPIENGLCTSHAGLPTYKRRRVSAVRDFPPGCGRFAAQFILKPNDKAACSDAVENSVKNDKVSSFPPKILECETANALTDLPQVDVDAQMRQMVVPSSLKSWSPHDLTVAEPIDNGLEKLANKNYPPRRRVSAVRDFPPFCGRSAPCLSKEECKKLLASQGDNCCGQDKSGIGRSAPCLSKEECKKLLASQGDNCCGQDKELTMTVTTELILMGNDVQHGNHCGEKLENYNSEPNGGKVKIESELLDTREMREQDQIGISSMNKMKVVQDVEKEKTITSLHESNQYHCDDMSTAVIRVGNRDDGGLAENPGKDIVVYLQDRSSQRNFWDSPGTKNRLHHENSEGVEFYSGRVTVLGLMATPNCPWRKGKGVDKPNLSVSAGEHKAKKNDFILLRRSNSGFSMKKTEVENVAGAYSKRKSSLTGESCGDIGQIVMWEDSPKYDSEHQNFDVVPRTKNFSVNLLPFGSSSSSGKDHDNDAIVTRNKVRETLRLFQVICRKLLQEEEAKVRERGNSRRRVDYVASKILKDKKKYVNTGKQIIGSVPGVEVGDEFQYRVELNIIGVHRLTQGGIDYVKQGGKILATSIVASGGYDDDLDYSDVLIYTGQGGNVMSGGKQPEDQKLERGNLALKNSINEKNPVRVVRGETKGSDSSARTYIYDGLYLVEKCWQDMGHHGKLVFKFRLVRIPGQPELAWKVVKKSKKFKVREGICVDDISQGKESIPICAVNTIDDETPPPFEYVTGMIYPNWCRPTPPKGCDCRNGCSESGKCSCVVKNGGEIPYNHNGAIVEVKSLVYECGPSCKCPATCYNRVSQHGIKFQLEIFKTESRGWGVRSLNSIPSGSFICEYAGELLEEKDAEQRTNDEYLFDIGNNYSDNSLWEGLSNLMPDAQTSTQEVVESGGFTIDAAKYGNVGRFINHSCSPNLVAQNVLYDHEDKRIPHIMLFAAENIPPLQELSYHYNYKIDHVQDSNGNIRKKSCFCGSSECTGRMY